jgi:glycerophosphoryl diester phosphodiesterase
MKNSKDYNTIQCTLYINIEVKTPYSKEIKTRYDYKNTISMIYELIRKYEIGAQCCVSSFDPDLLEELDSLRKLHQVNVEIIYLYNFYDHMCLPDPSIYAVKGDGINISSNHLTAEVIRNCHNNGKKVGVWIDASLFKESTDFYIKMMDMGVDFFCTDYPLNAMETKAQWLQEKPLHVYTTV